MSVPDVIVVGAGVVGITTALKLRAAGLAVLLVDKAEPAAGTSSGNAGAFAVSEVVPLAEPGIWRKLPSWLADPLGPLAVRWRYLPSLAPWLLRFAWASRQGQVQQLTRQLSALLGSVNEDFAPLIARSGLDGMWRRHGALAVYASEAALTADLPRWQHRGEHGVKWQALDDEATRQAEPALLAPWRNAVSIPEWSHVDDPYLFTLGLFEQFIREGGQYLQQEVTGLLKEQQAVRGVTLANGEQRRAGKVLITAGVWSDRFARQAGFSLPLESERGYHLTLPEAGMPLQRYLLNVPGSFVVLPMANGGIRLAGTVELAHRDATPDYRRAHLLLDKAQDMLGPLDTTNMTAWMGNRPSVPETVPVIGPSTCVDGLYFACGHGHLGLTLAATTARLLHDHFLGLADIPRHLWPDRYDSPSTQDGQRVPQLEIRS